MKKIITLLVIVAIGCAIYLVYKNEADTTVYQNTKFGYEVTLPPGWEVVDQPADKDNVTVADKSAKASGAHKVIISLSPSDISNFKEVNITGKITKGVTTINGFKGFIRMDSTADSKGTVVALTFTSDVSLTTNGADKQPKSIAFLLPGAVDEMMVMEIASTLRKI